MEDEGFLYEYYMNLFLRLILGKALEQLSTGSGLHLLNLLIVVNGTFVDYLRKLLVIYDLLFICNGVVPLLNVFIFLPRKGVLRLVLHNSRILNKSRANNLLKVSCF